MVRSELGERHALVQQLLEPGAVAAAFEGRLLRTREVALLFQVSERAVTDWARKGRIPSVRTPGGHRRYPADQVKVLLERSSGRGDDEGDA
jgi:excisionase family DNA binding protein